MTGAGASGEIREISPYTNSSSMRSPTQRTVWPEKPFDKSSKSIIKTLHLLLESDAIALTRPKPILRSSMILSENRFPLFGIMVQRVSESDHRDPDSL